MKIDWDHPLSLETVALILAACAFGLGIAAGMILKGAL